MITFKKDSFIITVNAPGNPHETWVDTYKELLSLFECSETDLTANTNFRCVYHLLKEMLPDIEEIPHLSKGKCTE